MKNIVLIPCWKRDDFLAATLDYLKDAIDAESHLYVFLLDRGYSGEVLNIAKNFPFEKILHKNVNNHYKGNSCNILDGYRFGVNLANERKSNLIYLIEEDIFVGKDFFKFHEAIQDKISTFCVSAVRCQNDNSYHIPDPSLLFEHNRFQSLGISWRPKTLETYILPHAKQEYYRNMSRYVLGINSASTIGKNSWIEQDGMISRVMEKHALRAVYPCVPRAFHAGFVGYNRPGQKLTGSLEFRVSKLKDMTSDEMNHMASEYKDIVRCDLKDHGVTDFKLENIC